MHNDYLQKSIQTKTKIKVLIELAKEVRNRFDLTSGKFGKDPSLMGCCALASWTLASEARNRYCIYPTMTIGHFDYSENHSEEKCNHAWIEYYGKIIDITATQFETKSFLPDEVFITSTNDKMYNSFHKTKTDIKDCLSTWPSEQNPLMSQDFLQALRQ